MSITSLSEQLAEARQALAQVQDRLAQQPPDADDRQLAALTQDLVALQGALHQVLTVTIDLVCRP
jgi:hypothetical protein